MRPRKRRREGGGRERERERETSKRGSKKSKLAASGGKLSGTADSEAIAWLATQFSWSVGRSLSSVSIRSIGEEAACRMPNASFIRWVESRKY